MLPSVPTRWWRAQGRSLPRARFASHNESSETPLGSLLAGEHRDVVVHDPVSADTGGIANLPVG